MMRKKFITTIQSFLSILKPDEVEQKYIEELSNKTTQAQANAAKAKIEVEVDYFITASRLDKINDYVRAGYDLPMSQVEKIILAEPFWLAPKNKEHSLLPEREFLQQYLITHKAQEIKDYILSAFTDLQPTSAKDDYNSLTTILSSSRFLYEWHEEPRKQMVQRFERASNKLSAAASLFQWNIALFQSDKDTFFNYQKEAKSLRDILTTAIKSQEEHENTIVAPAIGWNKNSQKGKTIYQMSQSLKKIESTLVQNLDFCTQDAHVETLGNIKRLYNRQSAIENLQDELKNNITEKINKVERNSLPEAAWEIIDRIQKTSAQLLPQIEKINHEDAFLVKNLTQNVLIETINGYIAVLPEFKAQLKSEDGKNLNDLFIESLQSIEAQLTDKASIVAEAQFKEVKTTHQYLKAKR